MTNLLNEGEVYTLSITYSGSFIPSFYLMRMGSTLTLLKHEDTTTIMYTPIHPVPQEILWTYKNNQLYNIDYTTNTTWYITNQSNQLTTDSSNPNTIVTFKPPTITNLFDGSASVIAYIFNTSPGNAFFLDIVSPINPTNSSILGSYIHFTTTAAFDMNVTDIGPISWFTHDDLKNKASQMNANQGWSGWCFQKLTSNRRVDNLPPSSILDSGIYQLSVNGKCLTTELNTVTNCDEKDPLNQWHFDATHKTLTGNLGRYLKSQVGLYQSSELDKPTLKTIACDNFEDCVLDGDLSGLLKSPDPFAQNNPILKNYQSFLLTANQVMNQKWGLCYNDQFNNTPTCYKVSICKPINTTIQNAWTCTNKPLFDWKIQPLFKQEAQDAETQIYPSFGNPQTNVYNQPSLCNRAPLTADETSIRLLDMQMKPISTKTSLNNFDQTQMQACCQGQHMVYQATNVLILQAKYTYDVAGGIEVEAFNSPANLNELLYLDDPDQIPRHIRIISEDPSGSKNIQLLPAPSQPSKLTYQKINLYSLKKMVDGRCPIAWCPWSDTCANQTNVVQDYCSEIDENGYPRINTDANCEAWCTSLDYKGKCGDAGKAFCEKYPLHNSCACQLLDQTPFWSEITKTFKNIPDCNECSKLPPVFCWAPQCTGHFSGPDRMVLNTENRLLQEVPCNLTICNQIIDIVNAKGPINITNNQFQQICGRDKNLPQLNCKYVPGKWSECLEGKQTQIQTLDNNNQNDPTCDKTQKLTQDCGNNIPTPTPPTPKPNPTPTPPSPIPSSPIPPTNKNTNGLSCNYDYSFWGLCQNETKQRTGTLRIGSDPACQVSVTDIQPCNSIDNIITNVPSSYFIGGGVVIGTLCLLFLSIILFKK